MLNQNLPVVVKRAVYKAQVFSQNTWVRLLFLGGLIFVLSQKGFSFEFKFGGDTAPQASLSPSYDGLTRSGKAVSVSDVKKTPQTPTATGAIVPAASAKKVTNISPDTKTWWEDVRDKQSDIRQELNLANSATAVGDALSPEQQKQAAQYSNLGLVINPGYAEKHGVDPAIVQAKYKICIDYINKYVATAQEEAKLFNVPASITLAQGLLESNAGDSKLASRDNNHFGIKCKKKCLGCRCANYTDDSRYDMFRIFDSPWGSFREHSKLLTGKRYKHLLKLERSDYKNWAHGLQAAGYATDKKYAVKLIKIVEAFQLQQYDA